MTLTIPHGTSEPQDVQLKNNGEAFDGTGFDVELVIGNTTSDGVGSPAPFAAWYVQAEGKVRISGVEVLEVGTYEVRYLVTDSGGGAGYFPNGPSPDEWEVVRVL